MPSLRSIIGDNECIITLIDLAIMGDNLFMMTVMMTRINMLALVVRILCLMMVKHKSTEIYI